MTFSDKLKAMERDLASIAHRMNLDGQPDVAMRAQTALVAVSAIKEPMDGWFDDLEWSWKPPKN